MNHAEMVALIRAGVPERGGTWADLGAGTGNFTRALAELLGAQGTIYAVDRDARALDGQRSARVPGFLGAAILPLKGDFTQPLALPPLDGVLVANALHFIRDQVSVLAHITGYLRPNGRFLLVEYDQPAARGWVPFPLPFERFQRLVAAAGLSTPALVGTRRSPSTGVTMYACIATRVAA